MKELIKLKLGDYETVYLPENLNLNDKIIRNPPMVSRYHDKPLKVVDRIATILGQISVRMVFNKGLERNIEDGYITLNATVLKELAEDYKPILEWALMVGIIETDGQYIAGEKSKGYRFSSEYSKSIRKHYLFDKILIRLLRRRRIDDKAVNEHPFLYKCLTEIEINNDAREEMRKLFDADVRLTDQTSANSKLYSRLMTIDLIADKRFFFIEDKNIHRLHTNITILKREARKYLHWKEHELINIDLKNSQPYFSLALFKTNSFNKLSLDKLIKHYNNGLDVSYMFPKNGDIFETYIGEYEEMVTSGKLYDYFANNLNVTRERAKKIILSIFFSVPTWDYDGKDKFIELFPQVWEVFKYINTGFSRTRRQGRKNWEQSNALAMLLTRIESTVMFEYIVPRIQKELVGLPIWTIHDSIMTIKGEEKVVAQIMREEAARVIGVPPTIDFE
jgi:hypothetical protein